MHYRGCSSVQSMRRRHLQGIKLRISTKKRNQFQPYDPNLCFHPLHIVFNSTQLQTVRDSRGLFCIYDDNCVLHRTSTTKNLAFHSDTGRTAYEVPDDIKTVDEFTATKERYTDSRLTNNIGFENAQAPVVHRYYQVITFLAFCFANFCFSDDFLVIPYRNGTLSRKATSSTH